MGQFTDIPYRKLKENKRAYEIMQLRDLYDNTFTDIAKEYELSTSRVIQIYNKIKIKQIRLYINHLSILNEHENNSVFRELYYAAYNCYQDHRYVTAYFEKEYKEILLAYRDGELGIPEYFISKMPSFRTKWSNKTIARVIEMRELEKKSYETIGKRLRMTKFKAEDLYQSFYHKKVLDYLSIIQKETGENVWDYYFRSYYKPKTRYDMIIRDYPNLFCLED